MKKALFQRKKHPSHNLPSQTHILEFSSFNTSVDIIKKYIENVNTETGNKNVYEILSPILSPKKF